MLWLNCILVTCVASCWHPGDLLVSGPVLSPSLHSYTAWHLQMFSCSWQHIPRAAALLHLTCALCAAYGPCDWCGKCKVMVSALLPSRMERCSCWCPHEITSCYTLQRDVWLQHCAMRSHLNVAPCTRIEASIRPWLAAYIPLRYHVWSSESRESGYTCGSQSTTAPRLVTSPAICCTAHPKPLGSLWR